METKASGTSKRWIGIAPLFDPADGKTVIEPLNKGAGWWAGAPSAMYDEGVGKFYLYYRLRKPRELGRGANCYITESSDGVDFATIWSAAKEDFDSPSIEKSSLLKTLEGRYRLYVSFVDPNDNKWRIDVIDAESPDEFDPASRKKVFTADDVGVEGVKDPYVMIVGRRYYMLLSYAPRPMTLSASIEGEMHATADVYNTGLTKSSSALATSNDGLEFEWLGDVFEPRDEGWDSYASRLGSVIYMPPVFNCFYDGSASVEENYEEKTGLAISFDLMDYERVTESGPILTSPHASGSLRYMDALDMGGEIYYYYEYARADGSHELRLNVVKK